MSKSRFKRIIGFFAIALFTHIAGCGAYVPAKTIAEWEKDLVERFNTDRRLAEIGSLQRESSLDKAASILSEETLADVHDQLMLAKALRESGTRRVIFAGVENLIIYARPDEMPYAAYKELTGSRESVVFAPEYTSVGIAIAQKKGKFSVTILVAALADTTEEGEMRPTVTGEILPADSLERFEKDLFDRVNAERASARVGQLETDPLLVAMARVYAKKMLVEGFFGHEEPSGGDISKRIYDSNLRRYRLWGENLASLANPSNPPAEAHKGLMSSPGHKANILNPKYTNLGVGAASDGRWWMFVQLFGQIAEEKAEENIEDDTMH